MGLRKIVHIDEVLCNGCGDCVTACAEGALRIVNGKARVVNDMFCDGFGDCIGECPTGALTIEERDTAAFDFDATREHVQRTGGEEAVRRLEAAAVVHEEKEQGVKPALALAAEPSPAGGCPGSKMRFRPAGAPARPVDGNGGAPRQAIASDLQQWPVQLHLVHPAAPYFKERELVVMNPCAPLASADVHWRFLRGRSIAMGCPKLDDTRSYAAKLADVLRQSPFPKATVVRMEVPCCGGLTAIAQEARALSGREDLVLEEVTVGVGGEVLGTRNL